LQDIRATDDSGRYGRAFRSGWTPVRPAGPIRHHVLAAYRSEQPSVESLDTSEGVVLEYDANGNLAGIDIDNASKKVQLQHLTLNELPSQVSTIAA